MTYLEKLSDAMDFIAKRHHDAKGVNTRFVVHQMPEPRVSDYEYWYWEVDQLNSEYRIDIRSLCNELNLPEPELISGFPAHNGGQGFIITNHGDKWNKEFRNAEFVESPVEEDITPFNIWRCSDEFFKKRYERFDRTIEQLKKLYGDWSRSDI